MLSKADLKKDRKLCVDRACGALIGHAIGDSFGDAARTPENHLAFGITMDFREGPAPGTDDTEFALLTAQTLIETRGKLTDDAILAAWRKHVLPLPQIYRGGASEREAAENIRRGILPPLSGQHNSHYMSDGAVMRIAPIGIVSAADPAGAARLAEIESRISHWRDGIWGAQAVAAGIAAAMAGGSVDEVFRAAADVMPPDSWSRATMRRTEDIIKTHGTLENAWMPLHHALWTEYKSVSPEAVAEAFAVFVLVKGDFRKGIIYAGNWGRDSDTIAAVVGSLCGAMHGRSGIPAEWVEKVRIAHGACLPFTKGMDIFAVAEQLASLI
jgi:ADP-ribosylglycohydrolase